MGLSLTETRPFRLPLILTGLALIVGAGLYIGRYGGDFQTVAFIGIALFGIFALVARRIEVGLVLWILLFSLGYRTIYLTENFPIHPLSILIFVLFIKVLIDARFSGQDLRPLLPAQLWFFSAFWVIGIVRGRVNGMPWDIMANDLLNFAILFPTFVVVQHSLQGKAGVWRAALLAFFAVGTWIALLGALETWFPGFQRILPGLSTGNRFIVSGIDEFRRSTFAFFGSPNAVFVCALTLPLALPIIGSATRPSTRIFAGVGFLTQIFAVYLSGYRSIWIVSALGLLLLIWLRSGSVKATIVAVVASILFLEFAPLPARVRLGTVLETLHSGTPVDSSLQKREIRTQDALEIALQEPLGRGWGASGWVHNDFAQVGANLGLFAGLLFLGWYLATLLKSLRRATSKDDLSAGLTASFVIAGGLLLTQGVEVLTQLVAPVWFVWAMLHVYLGEKDPAKA